MLIDIHELRQIIHAQIQVAIWECCHPHFASQISNHPHYEKLTQYILNDAIAYSNKDPASRNNIISIIQVYTSFKATLHYRISNFIHRYIDLENKRVL